MRKTIILLTLTILAGFTLLQAQVPVQIFTVDQGNPQGFITNSTPGSILFATSETAAPVEIPLSRIKGTGLDKGIRFDNASEELAEGRTKFEAGEYLDAAKAFAGVVQRFPYLLNIPQNFASEAMFYQIECFKRLGNFRAMAPLLETAAGKSVDLVLSDFYKDFSTMHKLWALYGKNDLAGLEAALAQYQEPVTGAAELLPAPSFKNMPPDQLSEIAFMRGKIFESKGEKSKALEDYCRAFSVNFANDSFISQQAMGAAMVIMETEAALKSPNEKVREPAIKQMQSLVYFFKKRFPETTLPARFSEYAVRPKVDMVLVKKEEPAKEEPAAEMPKEDAKGKGTDAKGKGTDAKGKGTDAKGKGTDAKGTDAKGTDAKGKDDGKAQVPGTAKG